mmetsp:Transcript_908/g.2029  ORF Transcript_908/g.2029 Transcript_908/m.2029 type:complete len:216 (-) Transcript_908:342-989(-)
MKNDFERTRDVLHIKEVAGVAPIPVQRHATTTKDLVGELWNQLLWELVGTIDVVPAGDDAGKLERAMVGFDQKFGPRFRGGVGVGGFQQVILLHRFRFEGFSLPVHLVRRHVDEPLDALVALGRLKKNMRSVDITLGEVERITERVVDVGLCGKVHNCVNLFLCHNVRDEVGAADVTLDELKVFETGYFVEVSEARTVVEFVIDDYFVLWVLFRE